MHAAFGDPMSMQRSLQVVLVVALLGLAFSGYLSYFELFVPSEPAMCTPVGAPGTVLGYPPCIYGFFMYLAIVIIVVLGLRSRRLSAHVQVTD